MGYLVLCLLCNELRTPILLCILLFFLFFFFNINLSFGYSKILELLWLGAATQAFACLWLARHSVSAIGALRAPVFTASKEWLVVCPTGEPSSSTNCKGPRKVM